MVSATRIDSRLLELTVRTPALAGPAKVRVLLPSGYASSKHRRYPVLYLLHGTSGGAADWTTMGHAEQATAHKRLIVVMPDIAVRDDGGGWCTNWFNGGARGRPEWEKFHIDELIPWIDHNLATIATRAGRAVAGLSQGGFCSMSYAARHPDLFSIALSFSGAPDVAFDATARALVTPVINLTETVLDHVPANSMFGPRATEELNWAAHDPTTLAANLRGMKLFMFTGNGRPGPLDRAGNRGTDAIESGVEQLTTMLHARLRALRIPSFFDDYGPGTHSWPYWTRDLRESIGPIMTDFAHPAPAPARITYTSADPAYSVFGWRVTMHRKAAEFSTLAGAGTGGFMLRGSGSATVITPARYERGGRYEIKIRSRAATRLVFRRARHDRRLAIHVPLGPSNDVQQYRAGGPSSRRAVYRAHVAIVKIGP